MKITIAGTGMEGANTITAEARRAINDAEILIGGERMLAPFAETGKELFVSYKPEDIVEKLKSCGCERAVILMSGDSGFFSGTKRILPMLAGHDVRVLPGISSMSCLCSRVGISSENMKPVSLHGRNANIAVNVNLNEYCFFILGGDMTAAEVCRRLCEYGLGDTAVHIGSDLGYPQERIISGKAKELTECETGKLSVMITDNWEHRSVLPSGITDGSFIRSEVPMTKSEVRCIAVSRLQVSRDAVVWDVGCGSGSVSVEAAFRCPDGIVLAFDKKPEAAALTRDNARLFGCDNIIVTEGRCPEMLSSAEAPDCVFIGGTSGNMSGVFTEVYKKNPSAQIVVTAVSLETMHDARVCFRQYGAEPEIAQISVSRAENVLGHSMMRAQNPVFIISGRLS